MKPKVKTNNKDSGLLRYRLENIELDIRIDTSNYAMEVILMTETGNRWFLLQRKQTSETVSFKTPQKHWGRLREEPGRIVHSEEILFKEEGSGEIALKFF